MTLLFYTLLETNGKFSFGRTSRNCETFVSNTHSQMGENERDREPEGDEGKCNE